MAGVTSAIIGGLGAAASVYGAKKQADAVKDASRANRGAGFSPYSFYGPGGMFAGVGSYAPGAGAPAAEPGMMYAGGSPAGGALETGVNPMDAANAVDPAAFLSKRRARQFDRSGSTDPTAFLGANAAAKYAAAQDTAFRNARGPMNIGGGQFDPASGRNQDIVTDLGDLNPARQAFLDQLSASFQTGQVPDYLYEAGAGAAADMGPLGVNPQYQYDQYGTYDRGLEAALRGTGMNALGIAGMDPQALGQQRYDLLAQQAAPGEQRAFNRLNDSLFSTGRLGTTGGGIQTEAFARGIAEADLSRQVQGMDFGRAVQADAMQRALGGFGQRDATRSMEEQLNQGTFGRGQQAYQNFFGNVIGAGQYNQNAAAQRFGLASDLFNMERQARSGATQDALANLGGISQLQNLSMDQLQAALQYAQARSGAAGNQAAVGANLARVESPWTQLGAGMLGGAVSQPGGLFGGMGGGSNMSGLSPINITAQRMPVPQG